MEGVVAAHATAVKSDGHIACNAVKLHCGVNYRVDVLDGFFVHPAPCVVVGEYVENTVFGTDGRRRHIVAEVVLVSETCKIERNAFDFATDEVDICRTNSVKVIF